MARPLRLSGEGCYYHVYHRGLERREIFGTRREREHFLDLLAQLPELFGAEVHAYCLMWSRHLEQRRLAEVDQDALAEFRRAWSIGSEAFQRECLEKVTSIRKKLKRYS
ncbi:MAG: hypothetical protein WCK89_10025, partial [bacterium]